MTRSSDHNHHSLSECNRPPTEAWASAVEVHLRVCKTKTQKMHWLRNRMLAHLLLHCKPSFSPRRQPHQPCQLPLRNKKLRRAVPLLLARLKVRQHRPATVKPVSVSNDTDTTLVAIALAPQSETPSATATKPTSIHQETQSNLGKFYKRLPELLQLDPNDQRLS